MESVVYCPYPSFLEDPLYRKPTRSVLVILKSSTTLRPNTDTSLHRLSFFYGLPVGVSVTVSPPDAPTTSSPFRPSQPLLPTL